MDTDRRAWPTRDLVQHRAASTPERTAVVDVADDTSLTYRELDALVGDTAAALASVGPDLDRVALLMDTRVAFAAVFFATMRLGASAVPLNARLTAEELTPRLERADVDVLVCEAATEPTAEAAFDGPTATVDEPEDSSVDSLTTAGDEFAGPARLSPDDEAVVMFTSGTTGRPKGVRLTAGNLLASATASAFRLGVTPGDRWLCCLPMYHMGGLAPVVRSALYGTTVLVQPEFEAERTGAVLDGYDATGVSLVPTMLRRMLDAGWTPSESLRFVLLGGAPARTELLDRCADRDVPAHPTYGMTETASQIATATPAQAVAHEGTVGQPLVNTTVTVVDEDGNRCGPGERGEFVVSGPTVTPGYLDDATTAEAFGEHGFHTGDVGYRDECGRLWVLNRKDDRIVTGGENVDPGEVVETLRSHPAVDVAAVVGLADPEWGERVAALVVPAESDALAADAVEAFCRERLAGFKCPRTIAVAESLPRTASGTVDRERVRERLRDAE